MKFIIAAALLILSFALKAQDNFPKFENDTLYTTCGYKIYKGLILQLSKGTGGSGKFRFIKYDKGDYLESGRFDDIDILVKQVYDYKISSLGNHYIGIKGIVTFKDKSKSKIDLDINFDRAIVNFAGLPAEIIIPDEFKKITSEKNSASIEIERLFNLYKEGALTKEEYEAQKKKVLDQ
jgi:hypothetical protein